MTLPYTPFIVTAQGRDGGNWLGQLISDHPKVKVRWDGEILLFKGKWKKYADYQNAKAVLTAETFNPQNSCKLAGLKLAAYMNGKKNSGAKGVWRYLRSLQPRVRVIHLERRNHLRAQLSMKIARKTGVWHTSADNETTERPTVRLEPRDLQAAFRGRVDNYAFVRNQFAGFPSLSVYYEDLVQNTGKWMWQVFDFLRVDPNVPVPESRTRLLETRPLVWVIENFREIRDHFAGSRWEVLFDDPI